MLRIHKYIQTYTFQNERELCTVKMIYSSVQYWQLILKLEHSKAPFLKHTLYYSAAFQKVILQETNGTIP